ncbi:MAG: hypothetical protein C5B53_13045 [Candidatus Melainabacteria bacterium]|nr:MAG: hypothetical protein C5B53_13045 [Candidatus Melainabacteria bacterium]
MSDGSGKLAHFNIALFAESDELIAACTKFARSNLAQYADGYLLGEDAWPHITLSQFIVEENKIASVWSAVESLRTDPIKLRFSHIYILPGVLIHKGKQWVGLALPANGEIFSLQKMVFDKLATLKIEGITKPNSYFPHLTWGRVKPNATLNLEDIPPDEFWRKEYSFVLSLGRSDAGGFGIYRERLFPTPVRSLNAV